MQNFTTNSIVAVARPAIRLKAGQLKLSAHEYEEILSLEDAWKKAQFVLEDMKRSARELHEQYRQEGLEMGRQDAQKEALEQLGQMQHSMNTWVKSTDMQLIDLVNQCVQEVVSQIDTEVISKHAVEKGLSELIGASQIQVRIKTITDDFRETVDDMIKRYGISGQVRIVEDGTLKEGDVIVESPVGIVDLRLEKQLQAIQKVLKP